MDRITCDKLRAGRRIGCAEVFTGRGIIPAIGATLKGIFTDGHVWLVYDDKVSALAEATLKSLRAAGYRVKTRALSEEGEAPEFARLIFAVGAGKAAARARENAERLDVDWVILATAPSTDTLLESRAPRQVYLDGEVLEKCPRSCVAAGWGIVFSAPLGEFEDYFAEKVLAAPTPGKQKTEDIPCDADETELALRLLELSAAKTRRSAAETMAVLLRQNALLRGLKPRMSGEYRFLAAGVLSVFYSSFLSSPAIDALPPASRDELIDGVAAYTGIDRANLLNSFDFFDGNSYFRISYILSEYRVDLLTRLSGIDMRAVGRRWRRLYPDAGYWLQKRFTARALIEALTLAGELDDGLLHFASTTGFCRALTAAV